MESRVRSSLGRRPILRRWDAEPKAIDLTKFVPLRSGLEVKFSTVPVPFGGFRSGDYWVVPARTVGGDVIWPRDANGPLPQPPHGVDHHYAPLARLDGQVFNSLRRTFQSLAQPNAAENEPVNESAAEPVKPRKRRK